MPKAKVRHGLVSYTVHDDIADRDYEDRAFRGMTIYIKDQKEYDRLLTLGAIVRPDEELALPGRLAALPETASDEEILNWAISATPAEIEEAARERPMLAARLTAAGEFAKERAAAWNEHLGGLVEAAEKGAQAGRDAAEREAADAPAPGVQPLVPEPGAGLTATTTADPATIEGQQSAGGPAPAGDAGDGTSTEDPNARFDAVVAGNRDSVIKYISENPGEASAILEAENRRAAAENEQPRVSVLKAVEVAAGHTV
jgi:hypothetical protein